ncbi:MAG: GIY-YIG nuclease family protein [Candidatus Hodarchaeota archaeon]
MIQYFERLTHPKCVFSRNDIITKIDLIPKKAGIYAWFFKKIPPRVPTVNCIRYGEKTLLYIGISPKRPPKKGKLSRQTLRNRIRYHYFGNAYGSTLRLTLGCILAEELGIQLRRVGSGNRMTFTVEGERILSDWMDQNAFVSCVIYSTPWELEQELLSSISLPLNLRGNENHPFYNTLFLIRSQARANAMELPIVIE